MSVPHNHEIPAPRLTEVSDGVFAYVQLDGSWWLSNTGFVVGRTGVIAVDACATEGRTRAFNSAISSVSAAPVRTLINTHHHGDHTYGNSVFSSATIVAHERCREQAITYGPPPLFPGIWERDPEWGDVELAAPFLTYRDGITLWADDLRCEVRFVGTPAHTDNDTIMWIPERKTLFAGDLVFNGGTPFLLGGSIEGALEVVEILKGLEPEVVVPGHGSVCGPEVIDDCLDYLHFVQETAAQGFKAGISPLELGRETSLGRFEEWLDPERIVGNLHRAYFELEGNERGAAIDMRSAMADMVTWNGGNLLTCLA